MGLFGKGEEVISEEKEAGMTAILSQLMDIFEAAALRVEDKVPHTILAALAVAFVVRLVVRLSIWHSLSLLLEYIAHPVPDISESIGLEPAEADDDGIESKPGTGSVSLVDKKKPGRLQCFDPSTLQLLGDVPAMTATEVNELCAKAKQAQKSWSRTTYAERRVVLRTIQKYIVNHIEEICRVCTRDSGAYIHVCRSRVPANAHILAYTYLLMCYNHVLYVSVCGHVKYLTPQFSNTIHIFSTRQAKGRCIAG